MPCPCRAWRGNCIKEAETRKWRSDISNFHDKGNVRLKRVLDFISYVFIFFSTLYIFFLLSYVLSYFMILKFLLLCITQSLIKLLDLHDRIDYQFKSLYCILSRSWWILLSKIFFACLLISFCNFFVDNSLFSIIILSNSVSILI